MPRVRGVALGAVVVGAVMSACSPSPAGGAATVTASRPAPTSVSPTASGTAAVETLPESALPPLPGLTYSRMAAADTIDFDVDPGYRAAFDGAVVRALSRGSKVVGSVWLLRCRPGHRSDCTRYLLGMQRIWSRGAALVPGRGAGLDVVRSTVARSTETTIATLLDDGTALLLTAFAPESADALLARFVEGWPTT